MILVYGDRSNPMRLSEQYTKTPDDGNYVTPPDDCNWCLIPKVNLTTCGEQQIPSVMIIEADFTGVENVTDQFSDHSHSETVGPPEVDYCYYTGATPVKYCDTTGYDVNVNLQAYWKRTWTPGTSTGTLSLHADFVDAGELWAALYELELLNTTYSNEDTFTIAANAILSQPIRRTLTKESETGTPPSSLVAPDTLVIICT